MESLESLDVKEAAHYLRRSERSVRRYLQAGRLEHSKEPLPAGGFKYLIGRQSLDLLKSELDTVQGRHAGMDMSGLDGLTAQVQDLQAIVQAQTDQIGRLVAEVQEFGGQLEQAIKALPAAPPDLALPAATSEDVEPAAREAQEATCQIDKLTGWWRKLLRL